jgi:hypothetical protein
VVSGPALSNSIEGVALSTDTSQVTGLDNALLGAMGSNSHRSEPLPTDATIAPPDSCDTDDL